MPEKSPVPIDRIARRIFALRGQKVMLSMDLAELYGGTHGALNQAVRRNAERFPNDFVFRLTQEEVTNLKSQSVISSWGGSRHMPYAFTEHGVAMLSSVLSTPRAIRVNIAIMRTFIRLRQILSSHDELARKLDELERRVDGQDEKIGFQVNEGRPRYRVRKPMRRS